MIRRICDICYEPTNDEWHIINHERVCERCAEKMLIDSMEQLSVIFTYVWPLDIWPGNEMMEKEQRNHAYRSD